MAMQLVVSQVLIVIVAVHGDSSKIWKPTNNLGDPSQWMDKQLPCPGQKIILPEDVMYFPQEMKLGPEIVLPNNGMVLFPDDAVITLLDQDEAQKARGKLKSCSKVKGDAVYKSPDFGHWHDPDNWRLGIPNRAVPHLHRIPCRFDTAVFPSNAAYKVSIQHVPIEISRLNINSIGMDSVSFRGLCRSELGKLMFKVNQSVIIHQDHCTDPRGCICGNQNVKDVVCSFPGGQCKGQAKCSGALKPKDHCCFDVCGSVIHIDTEGNDLKISTLHDVAKRSIENGNKNAKGLHRIEMKSNVEVHISRTSPTQYQMIFVDSEDDITKAVEVGRDVYKILYDLLYTKQGIYVWMEESGVSEPSALRSFGKAIGIIFGLGVIFGLLFLLKKAYYGPMERPYRVMSLPSISSISQVLDFSRNVRFNRFQTGNSSAEDPGDEMAEVRNRGDEQGGGEGQVEELDPSRLTFKKVSEAAEKDLNQAFTNPLYKDEDEETNIEVEGVGQEVVTNIAQEEMEKVEVEIDGAAKAVENPLFAKLISIESGVDKNKEEATVDNTKDALESNDDQEKDTQQVEVVEEEIKSGTTDDSNSVETQSQSQVENEDTLIVI